MKTYCFRFISVFLSIGLAFLSIPVLPVTASEQTPATAAGFSPTADSVPPAEVSDLLAAAGDGHINLSWKDPADEDFVKVKITGGGHTFYVAKGVQNKDITALINGAEYVFRLSTLDSSGNLSAGVTISAAPKDTTPPGVVTELAAEVRDGNIRMTWKDPGNIDLDRIRVTGNNNTYYIDKGIQLLTIGNLSDGSYCTYTVNAIDTSGNISEDTFINVVREAEASAILTGPGIVEQGGRFAVEAGLSCTRQDVYAADIKLKYSAELFEYVGYREAGNDIQVAGIEQTTPGCLRIFTVSSKPITGQNIRLVYLDFKAKAVDQPQTGSLIVEKAMVGTAPDGYSIEAAAVSMTVKVAAVVLPDVSDATAAPGDKKVALTWKDPTGVEFDHIAISGNGFDTRIIGKGIQQAEIDGLTNGKSYDFTIKVVDKNGNTSKGIKLTSTPSETDLTAPSEVSGLAVKPGNGKLTISWTDPADADFENVLISGDGIAAEIAKGVQEKVIDGLENGKQYTFIVKTRDRNGNVSAGLSISGKPGATGDINFDGVIDVADLAVFVYYYRVKDGDALWADAKICDITGAGGAPDGVVDLLDLVYVAMRVE